MLRILWEQKHLRQCHGSSLPTAFTPSYAAQLCVPLQAQPRPKQLPHPSPGSPFTIDTFMTELPGSRTPAFRSLALAGVPRDPRLTEQNEEDKDPPGFHCHERCPLGCHRPQTPCRHSGSSRDSPAPAGFERKTRRDPGR